jgi:outer membrane protein OmpA-like peptidoglycan-associated protein
MPRLALVTLLPCLFVARAAFAQESHPAMDARGYLTIDGSQTIGHEELSFGLGSLDWGHGVPGANDLVSATLVGAFGLNLGGVPLELGASLPVSIASGATNAQGLGDAGFHLKVHVATLGPLGLGLIGSIYAPTSSSPMFGNSGVTPELTGVADVALGRFRFAVNGGVRHGTLAMDDAMPSTMATTQFPAGVAGAWAVVPQKFELVGEVFADDVSTHQLQALGGVKLYLAKNSYLALGAGRGLASDASAAGTPDFRAMIGIVFEPKPAPQVRATVPDAPDEPVRAQVVAQDDPPPPQIDDSPIVPDNTDGCTHDKPTDDADCPDRAAVVVGKSDIVILKSIDFEFDKAIIQKKSYPILDAVALALHDNPDIDLVEVRGHTDERGDDAYNLDLSDRRAAAVVTYLIGKGISADRLTSTGYGETLPLDPRHNEEAWAKNRRVEFQIRKRNGELL